MFKRNQLPHLFLGDFAKWLKIESGRFCKANDRIPSTLIMELLTLKRIFTFFVMFANFALASDSPLPKQIALPPTIEFNGSSQALIATLDDPWVTPSEATGLQDTPSYDETVQYLQRLVKASPALNMVSLGTSLEGRAYWMVIANNKGLKTPEEIESSGLPVVLVQAGIHSGEIDGKDAGLMLLRDMTVKGQKTELLDDIVFLFIPILNVDGHERRSPYNRINQRGPTNMGWRTNAANLNLNRDYTKADTEGMQAVLKALRNYSPDLYVDIHVTDGIDYQYDVTFGANGTRGFSPKSGLWLENKAFPALNKALRTAGHIPGPLIFARDHRDLSKGIVNWFAGPRFSNGYGDLVHVPTILVENHSLKPYRQRVLGTYIFLEALIQVVKSEKATLFEAISTDKNQRTERIPTKRAYREKPEPMSFLGIKHERYPSEISGQEEVRWLGQPETIDMDVHHLDEPKDWIQKPKAFWIPGSYPTIIQRLAMHGIEMSPVNSDEKVTLSHLKFAEPNFSKEIYEGHFRVSAEFVVFRKEVQFPENSVRVDLDQPLGDLVMVLLDPRFADSFFQWGFFNQIFQRTEYTEAYAIEPHAQHMMKNTFLAEAFKEKVEGDEAFRNDPRARLYWFYEKTPYYDQAWKVYPIGIED